MVTKLKKGDKVVVTAGKDKGKEGRILMIDRKKMRVVVEGVNIIKKHQKPNAMNQAGGIVEMEAPLSISNVMYLHKGKATRLGMKLEGSTKKRFAKSTGEIVD